MCKPTVDMYVELVFVDSENGTWEDNKGSLILYQHGHAKGEMKIFNCMNVNDGWKTG